ncbi:PEGA domain-containing protein [Bdellovibrionota bacterium FG-2]
MTWYRVFTHLVIFLTLAGGVTWASSRPEWVEHPPGEDAHFKYYVGRAAASPNESIAVSEATRDASEAAIRENFGFKTEIQTQSYETVDKSASTKRIQEISRRVEIHDFEQTGFYREQSSEGRMSAWVLYKYSKAAIAREKARLASVKEEDSKVVFSQQGSELDSVKGVVEVVSKPIATVYIDGERWGKSPLRLMGQLPVGEHMIRLDHPAFESAEEKIIVVQGATVKVSKALLSATGKLKVVTDLPNATVVIDGKLVGTTPTEYGSVPAATKIRVEISHAEAERLLSEVEVAKNTQRELNLNMTLKPAFLSITSTPNGAKVKMDGSLVSNSKTPTGMMQVEAGLHSIEVILDGFESKTEAIELRGGERKTLPHFSLESIAETERKRNLEETERAEEHLQRSGNPRWTLALIPSQFVTSGVSDPALPLYQIGVSAQYRIFPRFGVELATLVGWGKASYADAQLAATITTLQIGTPIILTRANSDKYRAWLLKPLLLANSYQYSLTYSANGVSHSTSKSQVGAGILTGARTLSKIEEGDGAQWGVGVETGSVYYFRNNGGIAGRLQWVGALEILFAW